MDESRILRSYAVCEGYDTALRVRWSRRGSAGAEFCTLQILQRLPLLASRASADIYTSKSGSGGGTVLAGSRNPGGACMAAMDTAASGTRLPSQQHQSQEATMGRERHVHILQSCNTWAAHTMQHSMRCQERIAPRPKTSRSFGFKTRNSSASSASPLGPGALPIPHRPGCTRWRARPEAWP